MKKALICLSAIFAFAMVASLPQPAVAGDSWTGWITDSHCGAKGAKAGHESCAKRCVEQDGEYVFYNSADKKIYKLDNQELAAENLGYEVTVSGSAEEGTITVESIEKAG